MNANFVTAAISGILLASAVGCASTPAPVVAADGTATAAATEGKSGCGGAATGGEAAATIAKHDCKGQNECKGQGGCAVEGKNTCKGQNECKGHGGCKTS
jgi:hypothetical protein